MTSLQDTADFGPILLETDDLGLVPGGEGPPPSDRTGSMLTSGG